jgi:mutator protein MutT
MVTDSGKSLKCIKCGFCYFINMSTAVAAIIRNDKNEILFTIRKHQPARGTLDLPGGFVDLGETAETALVREILEELNLEIRSFNYEGSFTNKYLYKEIEYQTLDLVFNCTVETFDTLQVADDVADYIFRDPSTVKPEEIGLDSIKEIVRKINENRNRNHLLK